MQQQRMPVMPITQQVQGHHTNLQVNKQPAVYKRNIMMGSTSPIKNISQQMKQVVANTEVGRAIMNDPKTRAQLAVARKILGGTAKVVGRVALGTIGGTIGLAAGIAGDDLDDVLKYGASGVAVGTVGLPAAVQGLKSATTGIADDLRYTYNKEMYGQTDALLMEQSRIWMNNETNIDYFRDYYRKQNNGAEPTADELDQVMEQACEYYNADIGDNNDISKAMNFEKTIQHELAAGGLDGVELVQKSRAVNKTIAKMVKSPELTKDKLLDKQKRNNIIHSWKQEFIREHNKGDKEAEELAKYVMSLVMRYSGLYVED